MDRIVAILESQILWGIVTLILAASAFSGKLSMSASRTLLVIAWLLTSISIFRLIQVSPWVLRGLLTMFVVSIVGFGFYYLDQWLLPRNFCYFQLYTINGQPQMIGNAYQLAMTATGDIEKMNYWIAPASARQPNGQPNDPYYSIDIRKPLHEIVHSGGRAWARSLPQGSYYIDFEAKGGKWEEHFEINVMNGVVTERIRVMNKHGETLYDSETQ